MSATTAVPSPRLTSEALATLTGVAVEALRAVLRDGVAWVPEATAYGPELARPGAAFVTLERDEVLLGCVGTLASDRSLATTVADRAVAAAWRDPRFPGITVGDFEAMHVAVSVLTPLEPVAAASLDELAEAVRDEQPGVVVALGGRTATFLPKVWHHLPEPAAFLAALWAKAGLPPGSWPRHLEIWRYRTLDAVARPPRRLDQTDRPQA